MQAREACPISYSCLSEIWQEIDRDQQKQRASNKSSLNAEGGANVNTIRVSTRSRTTSVAGAIAGVVREHGRAEVQSIGAGAVNQAIKAAAIATGFLALEGSELICSPTFTEVSIDGEERTAVRLTVEPR
jgi:stage V sporulation protein S